MRYTLIVATLFAAAPVAAFQDPGMHDPGMHDPGTHDPGTHDPGTQDPGTQDPGMHDPGMHADHARILMEIVPVGKATHKAVQPGFWSSPATWQDGAAPGAGARVHIPAGVQVTYDRNSNAPMHWVRVDGSLVFSRAMNAQLTVETLVVGDVGRLEIGTKANPLITSATIELRRVSPALHWSRVEVGILVLGELSIWGQATTSWTRLATNPRLGDQTITFAQGPSNWRSGGVVVVPGILPHIRLLRKHLKLDEPDPRFREQHELRQVTGISGATAQLAEPLAQDTHHQLPAGRTIAVGYLSRNIVIQSADTSVENRGHVMLMPTIPHKNYQLGYFSLVNLGRTHTELHVTDPQLDDFGLPIADTLANPRGRYALHFHKMGPDNYALVKGVAVIGALKWGIVNHGSVVDVEDCVSYDCDGAHYATESGQEQGSFVRNMGVRSQGFGKANNRHTSPRFLGGGGQDKKYTDKHANRLERMRIAPLGPDFGFAGYGIWLQGPLIRCEGNELYGAFDAGITVKTTPVGTDHNGQPVTIPRTTLPADIAAALPASFGKRATPGQVPVDAVPYTVGANNVYGCNEALVGMDNGPPQTHRSKFQGGSNYNCHIGQRNWESNGQIIDGVEFLNDASCPGQVVNSFYDGSSNMLFTNVKALNFKTGIDVPQTGTNVIEGAGTLLRCQNNIHFQAETNASNRTFIRLADSNFGLPTATGKGWEPEKQLNINMQLHKATNTRPQRNVEWQRPGLPAVRLWSNPEIAPAEAFSIPKFNGVASPIDALPIGSSPLRKERNLHRTTPRNDF